MKGPNRTHRRFNSGPLCREGRTDVNRSTSSKANFDYPLTDNDNEVDCIGCQKKMGNYSNAIEPLPRQSPSTEFLVDVLDERGQIVITAKWKSSGMYQAFEKYGQSIRRVRARVQ